MTHCDKSRDGKHEFMDEAHCYHCGTLRQGRSNDTALELAMRYGQIDGDHHKAWVIDQMVRALAGDNYDAVIVEYCDGTDGPMTYEWNVGIAP